MDSLIEPQSLQTCVSSFSPVQPESTEDLRTWLQQDFHASPFRGSVNDAEEMTTETSGPKPFESFAMYDRDSRSWKTPQVSLIPGILTESSVTWPKAGMVCAGVAYRHASAERRISETDYGFWPTPTKSDATGGPGNSGRQGGLNLRTAIHRVPTPSKTDYKGSARPGQRRGQLTDPAIGLIPAGGQLSPMWVEWLMGWPVGWTELRPLATDRFQSWLLAFGSY